MLFKNTNCYCRIKWREILTSQMSPRLPITLLCEFCCKGTLLNFFQIFYKRNHKGRFQGSWFLKKLHILNKCKLFIVKLTDLSEAPMCHWEYDLESTFTTFCCLHSLPPSLETLQSIFNRKKNVSREYWLRYNMYLWIRSDVFFYVKKNSDRLNLPFLSIFVCTFKEIKMCISAKVYSLLQLDRNRYLY